MTSPSRVAIFPGSFDPFTTGHGELLARATTLFDQVVVAVLVNAVKRPMFSLDERIAMIRESTTDLAGVDVASFDGLLVDYARRRGATAVVRGLRSASDFAYEQQMAQMNRHLRDNVETVFLSAAAPSAFISSSLVREVIAGGGPLDGLVSDAVRKRVEAHRQAAFTRKA